MNIKLFNFSGRKVKRFLSVLLIVSTLITWFSLSTYKVLADTTVYSGDYLFIQTSTTNPTSGGVTVSVSYYYSWLLNATISVDNGATFVPYTAPVTVYQNCNVIVKLYYGNYLVETGKVSINNIIPDNLNGSWNLKKLTLKNTPEAQLMVRVGDIDNFGFGWAPGFNPFSGNSTAVHSFPWSTPADEPAGLDRIMVVSSYVYGKGTIGTPMTTKPHTDGYTQKTSRPGNYPQAINLSYDLSGINVNNAILQMFVDDFQAGNSRDVESQVSYQVTINGIRVPELENLINSLDQSGPIGKMVSFQIPNQYISLVKTGNMSIKIDDPVVRINGGDGYAIDFVKLLVNPTCLSQTANVRGTVKDAATGKGIPNATVSSGGVVKATTDSSGNYILNKIPAGLALISASAPGYTTVTMQKDCIAGSDYTDVNFNLQSTTKPGTPIIYEDVMTPTNANVNISVDYPDNPTVKQINYNGSWVNYTGPVSIGQNTSSGQPIQARSQSAAGVWSDIATFDITNIDKSIPNAPILSQDITSITSNDVTVTASFPANAVSKKISLDTGLTWTDYTAPVVLSQNATVMAKYTNSAGTWSELATLVVSNIDKTRPSAPTFSADISTITNSDVTVTITYPSSAVVKQYSLDNGATWQNYSTPLIFKDNGMVKARCQSAAGSWSDISAYSVNNIDKSVPDTPTLTANPTTPTNGNVTVTVTYPAAGSINEYSLDNGTTWKAYTGPITMTDNGLVQARSKNSAGTYSKTGSINIANIDKSPVQPPTLTPDNTAITNGNVTVTASYPSNAVIKKYSVDNGNTWQEYTTPIIISQNSIVKAKCQNAAGTWSDITSLTISNIDSSIPDTPVITADPNVPTSGDVVVTVTYPSEMTRNWISDDGGKTWKDYNGPISVSSNTTIVAKCQNAAGTWSKEASLVIDNIDKSVPTTPTFSLSVSTPTNKDVSVTINYPSSAVVKQYSLDEGKTWIDYVSPFTVEANTTVQAKGKNAAGTWSEVGSISITNIDKTAPTAEISYYNSGDGTITAKLVNQSEAITITNNNGSDIYTFTSTGTFTFEFVDAAGNKGIATASATIDGNTGNGGDGGNGDGGSGDGGNDGNNFPDR